MKKFVLAMLVVGLLCLATGMASAWTESFESYATGTTPYGDWALGNGTWQPVTGGQANDGAQSYHIVGGATSRIGRPLDFVAADASSVILEGWFYDSNGASSTERSFLGFQSDFAVNNALLRIGMNNTAQYQVHYVNGSLQMLNTGLNNETGWHYVKLSVAKADATNWTVNWQINAVNGTPYTGTFTFPWSASTANKVVVGYNYSTTNPVDWDNINVTGVVPEPSSMVALATGLIGLVGFGTRRRK
jgi:hypothetical protein